MRKPGRRVLFVVCLSNLIAATSCQQNSSDLEVAVTPSQTNLIDASAETCVDAYNNSLVTSTGSAPTQTAAPLYLRFNSIKLLWKGTDDLYLSYVRVTLSGDNLSAETSCTFSGQEMNLLFGIVTKANVPSPKYPNGAISANNDHDTLVLGPATNDASALRCYLTCGGVAVKDPKNSSTFQVKIQVVGYETDGTNENPVSASALATANYSAPQ